MLYPPHARRVLNAAVSIAPASIDEIYAEVEDTVTYEYTERVIQKAASEGELEKEDNGYVVPTDSPLRDTLAEDSETLQKQCRKANDQRILAALARYDSTSSQDIARDTGLSEQRVMKTLDRLRRTGDIFCPAPDEYAVADRSHWTATPTANTTGDSGSKEKQRSYIGGLVGTATGPQNGVETGADTCDDGATNELSPTGRVKKRYVNGDISDVRLDTEMARAVREEYGSHDSLDEGFDSDVDAVLETESAD